MARQHLGGAAIAAVLAANLGAWLAFPPADDGSRPDFARQLASEVTASTMVVLLACALVLATRARPLERCFGGLDRMYRAHRVTATAAFLLLLAHFALTPLRPGAVKPGTPPAMMAGCGLLVLVLLALAPRLPVLGPRVALRYDRWRTSHWLAGVCFLLGFAHMMLVDPLVRTTAVPFAVLVAAFAAGAAAFLHVTVVARLARRPAPHLVTRVRRLNRSTVEVTLRPLGKRLAFTAGQFLFVAFDGDRVLKPPHPFTVSSSPRDADLRLTVKAGGAFTSRLYQDLRPGTRARVDGCYGRFDYRRGGPEQVWVAGGIGITPFLSWLRDLGDELDREIDLFYAVRTREDGLFADEIRAVARRHPRLRAHVTYSAEDGSLTAARIAATSRGSITAKDVFMCGPARMVRAFRTEFRRLGVAGSAIHFEVFNFR